ncbi:hypothetical protein JQM34_0001110 [Streptococcus oralis]|nr:hypothetical protein JQM34_0001110 [Streptococcus oralis]
MVSFAFLVFSRYHAYGIMEKDIFFLFLEIRIFFENGQMLSTVESI